MLSLDITAHRPIYNLTSLTVVITYRNVQHSCDIDVNHRVSDLPEGSVCSISDYHTGLLQTSVCELLVAVFIMQKMAI